MAFGIEDYFVYCIGRVMHSRDRVRMIYFEFEAVVDIIKVLSNYME